MSASRGFAAAAAAAAAPAAASASTQLTARKAARQAAQKAAAVHRALVRAPPAPAPVGLNVEVAELRAALPWLRWKDLQEFVSLFGQRGVVVTSVASSVAEELARRLTAPNAGEAPSSTDAVSGSAMGMAGSELRKPWEVATVTYAFAKVTPQQTEYLPIYAAVAEGAKRNLWDFNRLQRGLVATALADAGVRLDALPALLRPALRGLGEDAEVTPDELRYLVHACAHLPGPSSGCSGHLTPEEAETLAACVVRLAPVANFAKAAHIVVGWLRVQVPAPAKAAYLDALQAACVRLYEPDAAGVTLKPMLPAHPLPLAGLAPAISALIAREDQRDPPPLTPPRLRSVSLALVQICRGVLSDASSRRRHVGTRALSLADWVEILELVSTFCEAHGPLPGWAAEVLGFVTARVTTLPSECDGPPEPETLLGLLRLCGAFRPKSTPFEQLYEWIATKLVVHRSAQGDSAALVEAVRQLVPRLPEARRAEFVAVLQAQAEADASLAAVSTGAQVAARGVRGQRVVSERTVGMDGKSGTLLAGQVWRQHVDHPSVTLSASGIGLKASAPVLTTGAAAAATEGKSTEPGSHAQATAARLLAAASSGGAPGGHLWRLLAVDDPAVLAPRTAASRVENTSAERPLQAPPGETVRAAARTESSAAGVEAPSGDGSDRLRGKLEQALQRVEALEARLEERLEELDRRAEEAATLKATAHVSASSEPPPAEGEAPQLPRAWGAPDLSADASEQRTASVFSLHRPFSFEEFRRANSARLQAERLRVLLPPGRVPILPLPRK